MPQCTGKTPCTIGKPHDVPLAALQLDDNAMRRLALGKQKRFKSNCGSIVIAGDRARKKARKAVSALSHAVPEDQIIKELLEQPDKGRHIVWKWFEAYIEKKHVEYPATVFTKGSVPIVYFSVDTDAKGVSREIFNPEMGSDESKGIWSFYSKAIPDLNIVDEAEDQS
jgi:hypothetical protein